MGFSLLNTVSQVDSGALTSERGKRGRSHDRDTRQVLFFSHRFLTYDEDAFFHMLMEKEVAVLDPLVYKICMHTVRWSCTHVRRLNHYQS